MGERVAAGTYRGKAVAGSEQYGMTKNGHDQVVLDLELLDIGERVSTFLVFSDAAAPYSLERLRALGWQGSDLSDLSGIDTNEVDVEVAYEDYQGKQQMKVQILTGNGRVVLKQQMDDKGKRAFAARFKALAAQTGSPAAASAARKPSGGAGGNAPPTAIGF